MAGVGHSRTAPRVQAHDDTKRTLVLTTRRGIRAAAAGAKRYIQQRCTNPDRRDSHSRGACRPGAQLGSGDPYQWIVLRLELCNKTIITFAMRGIDLGLVLRGLVAGHSGKRDDGVQAAGHPEPCHGCIAWAEHPSTQRGPPAA